MDDLKEIYERMRFLRQKGVKMKTIAERLGMAPSVVSALFTTVMPVYLKNRDKGMEEEAALDEALVWVNNVSRKKLLGSLGQMKAVLFRMEAAPRPLASPAGNRYAAGVAELMRTAVNQVTNFSGVYMSYSVSSSSGAMKMEPYLIAPSAAGDYVEVVHRNAYGSTHQGFAMMNGGSHLYLLFNENRPPQLALFNICLKLPLYDRPPYLRGIYTCLDYNYNPIARRILFVKLSDSVSPEDFLNIQGGLKQPAELDEREKLYYDYTCGEEDVVRMRDVAAPRWETKTWPPRRNCCEAGHELARLPECIMFAKG